jgi:RNAse (barnase) inhibitor barstar
MMAATPKSLNIDRSGVYLAPRAVAPLRRAAARAQLAWFELDLDGVDGKARLLSAFAQELDFPNPFGANWDALADCLQDFSWRRAAGYVINVTHARDCALAAPQEFSQLLEILRLSTMYWRERGRIFLVLLDHQPGDLPLW